MKIFVIISIVWAGLWGMGGVLFFQGAGSYTKEAQYVMQPLTGVVRGGNVRINGRVMEEVSVTELSYVTGYTDKDDQWVPTWNKLATRRKGPPVITFETGQERITLPVEKWRPAFDRRVGTSQLPEHFHVTEEELAAAKARASGTFSGYGIEEETLHGGSPVFIIGHLSDALELSLDPTLGKLLVFRGTQADYVRDREGNVRGLRIAGVVFFVLAALPLVVLAFWRRKK